MSWAWSSSTEVGIPVGAVTADALLSLLVLAAGLKAEERASPRLRLPIGSSLILTEGAGPEFPGTTRFAAGVKCSSGDTDR